MSSSEKGSVLFYILIAVVLLAALTYAINQSQRGNLGHISSERTRLVASEILEYANTAATAAAQLRLRGVKDVNLCLDDAGWGNADYTHAGCSENSNKLFHLRGGGVTWGNAPSEAMDASATPDNLWHIYGDNEIEGIGSTCGDEDCSELLLVVDELRQDVCMVLNELLSITDAGVTPPTDTDIGRTTFVGVFDYTATIGDEAGGEPLSGRSTGCFLNTNDSKYTFYKVLISR